MEYPLGQRLRELPGPLLLTGHTGFKGTWMTFLLEYLNVPVVGYSLPPEKDSLFKRAARTGAISEVYADIRDYEALKQFINLHKPSTIIHMAAQPLVLKSYETPHETFDVNVMGTANVLDIAFKNDFVKAIIVVTTDKVYRNDDSGKAFVETDPLEGKDPYSASKVATEAVVKAWQKIESVSGGPKVIAVRAGNIIGGGDYGQDRLFPDLIRSMVSKDRFVIRNPDSTRPWQHVLDPLTGYVLCLEATQDSREISSINLGPTSSNLSVRHVIDTALKAFGQEFNSTLVISESRMSDDREGSKLDLDSSYAREYISYRSVWNQETAIQRTVSWWSKVLAQNKDAAEATLIDIKQYFETYREFL